MSETITRARETIRKRSGHLDPLSRAIDLLLERGQAAEEGLLRDPGDSNDFGRGYRRATLELAESIADAIERASR